MAYGASQKKTKRKRKKGKREREEKDWTPEAHKYGQEGRGPAAGRGGTPPTRT